MCNSKRKITVLIMLKDKYVLDNRYGDLVQLIKQDGNIYLLDGNLDYMPEDYLFGCKLSAEFKIPSVVKKLSYSCFSHASGIDFLEIPESVTEIDELVFFNSSMVLFLSIIVLT